MDYKSLPGFNKQISLLLQGLFQHSGGCLWERTQGKLRPPQLDGRWGDGWRCVLSELHARGWSIGQTYHQIFLNFRRENIFQHFRILAGESECWARGKTPQSLLATLFSWSSSSRPYWTFSIQLCEIPEHFTTKVSGSIKVIQLELTNGTRSFCEIKYDYFLRS